ncbi:MAG: hypothetical protein HY791_16420 [Deltaproteobacteria bacterium]|nr:hypothetical protein [Deltaproteobacteria bacterium]
MARTTRPSASRPPHQQPSRILRLVAFAFVNGCGASGWVAIPDEITIVGAPSSRLIAVAVEGANGLTRSEVLEATSTDSEVAVFDEGRVQALRPGSAVLSLTGDDGGVDVEVHVLDLSPFATQVLGFAPGAGAGFGSERMPDVVLGPPKGGGELAGSFDVVSLGAAGRIELGFDRVVGVDGRGADLAVFENPFSIAGSERAFKEPGAIEVRSAEEWRRVETQAGLVPVLAGSSDSSIDPRDPNAGGDRAELGSNRTFDAVAIVDGSTIASDARSAGFDLDAVMLLHAVPVEVSSIEGAERKVTMRVGERRAAPRFDALGPSGPVLRGLDAKLTLSSDGAVAADCDLAKELECEPILEAVQRGHATLKASYGPWTFELPIEVIP